MEEGVTVPDHAKLQLQDRTVALSMSLPYLENLMHRIFHLSTGKRLKAGCGSAAFRRIVKILYICCKISLHIYGAAKSTTISKSNN